MSPEPSTELCIQHSAEQNISEGNGEGLVVKSTCYTHKKTKVQIHSTHIKGKPGHGTGGRW